MQGITQVLDNFTLIKGRHSFKQGFDFQYVDDSRAVPLTAIYTFPTVAAYQAAKAGTAPLRLHDVRAGHRRSELRDGEQAVQRVLAGRLAPDRRI